MNNVKKSIGWSDFTWNPITGCARTPPCPYCYAKRIHDRFNPSIPFSNIEFHIDRLFEPVRIKRPLKIFVGSMSDIEYWKPMWIDLILDTCRDCPQHTFMFLSKSSKSYLAYKWPENTMQGLTLAKRGSIQDDYQITRLVGQCPRPFLSIEPILGSFHFNPAFSIMEMVIVGAMTGPGAIKPKPEWVQSIMDNVPAEKIFWKNNIKKYL